MGLARSNEEKNGEAGEKGSERKRIGRERSAERREEKNLSDWLMVFHYITIIMCLNADAEAEDVTKRPTRIRYFPSTRERICFRSRVSAQNAAIKCKSAPFLSYARRNLRKSRRELCTGRKLTYELAMLLTVFFADTKSMVAFAKVQCLTFGRWGQLALNVMSFPFHSDAIIIL